MVRTVNDANTILPAGDVRIGPKDYNIYTNSQLPTTEEINRLPLKSEGNAELMVADVGYAKDAAAIQTNIVRVDGQRSVYLPILKQGGNSNTIAIVNGIKKSLGDLFDVPKSLVTKVVFDQSVFVKTAIANLGSEGGIGLVLTALMILIFLGNVRATFAVMLSIPLSALAAFLAINASGGSINTMVLGGLALAFSRLIDNSVVVLENIFRHLEMGETPEAAAEKGGREVAMPVLAATFTTSIVFFPVVFLYGVSRFLFTALAAAVVFSLFASYAVAMTVVPLFCANFIKSPHEEAAHHPGGTPFQRFVRGFNRGYDRMLMHYDIAVRRSMLRPMATFIGILGICLFSFGLFPLMGLGFFPRTDPGQFVINIKAPTGTRLELTNQYIKHVEADIREVVAPSDLDMVVSNIGITPDFSAIYTSNSGQHTAFVQVSLKKEHSLSSFEYMRRVRAKLTDDLPELSTYFQSGGLVDAVVNLGLPAPIDIQVSGNDQKKAYQTAAEIARRVRRLKGASDVLIPQDLDYPGIQLNINREMAGRMGVSSKEAVDNVITALTSDSMIAPSYWVDPKNGNNYMLTVQYPETQVNSITDLKQIPLHAAGNAQSDRTRCGVGYQNDQHPNRGGPLPDPARHRCIRCPAQRGSRKSGPPGRQDYRQYEGAGKCSRHHARLRRRHASVVQELWHRLITVSHSSLFDSDGAVLFVHRSADHPARHSTGHHGRHSVSAGDAYHGQCYVLDGRHYDDRDRSLEQHSHRRVHAISAERRHADPGSGSDRLSRTLAPGPDDLVGHDSRHDSDGPGARSGQRTICSPGPRHYWRTYDVGRGDCFHRSRSVSIDPSARRRATGASHPKLRSTIES